MSQSEFDVGVGGQQQSAFGQKVDDDKIKVRCRRCAQASCVSNLISCVGIVFIISKYQGLLVVIPDTLKCLTTWA